MSRIVIALAQQDFDPTEVAIPWKVLTAAGHDVLFATQDGQDGHADQLMLTGEGLDVWGLVPGLKHLPLMGGVLRANSEARAAYRELEQTPAFHAPTPFRGLRADDYDALILPGGHRARGCARISRARSCRRSWSRCSRLRSRSARSVTACSSPRGRSHREPDTPS